MRTRRQYVVETARGQFVVAGDQQERVVLVGGFPPLTEMPLGPTEAHDFVTALMCALDDIGFTPEGT